jgi:acyl-CoA thioesterase
MEVRFVTGGFNEVGPATVWMRMRQPLIAGQETLPVARALIAADSGNGVSGALPYERFLFINPDLTVYLHRLPVGEWICLSASTTAEPHGIGLSESQIYDETGPIGRGLQGLFISQRT